MVPIGHVFLSKITNHFIFDSFGGAPDKLLLNQLAKPIIYHNSKNRDKNSSVGGVYCLNIFYLIDGMKFYDAVYKISLA